MASLNELKLGTIYPQSTIYGSEIKTPMTGIVNIKTATKVVPKVTVKKNKSFLDKTKDFFKSTYKNTDKYLFSGILPGGVKYSESFFGKPWANLYSNTEDLYTKVDDKIFQGYLPGSITPTQNKSNDILKKTTELRELVTRQTTLNDVLRQAEETKPQGTGFFSGITDFLNKASSTSKLILGLGVVGAFLLLKRK